MKIAHLADLHLGFTQGNKMVDGMNLREADVADAFAHVVTELHQRDVDLIVVAGDVFHSPRPSNAAIRIAVWGFRRLLRQAPVVIVAGNHDLPRNVEATSPLAVLRQLGCHVVDRQIETLMLRGDTVSVLCIPEGTYRSPPWSEASDILVMHGAVGDTMRRIVPDAIPLEELQPERWQYVALGHWHQHEVLAPNCAYAGSLERVAPNYWIETLPKSFILYDTDKRWMDVVPVPSRRMIVMPIVDATGLDADELVQVLDEQMQSRSIAGALVRQVVVGVRPELQGAIDWTKIREWQRTAAYLSLDLRHTERAAELGNGPGHTELATVEEEVRAFLHGIDLPPGVDRDEFVAAGLDLVAQAKEGGEK